MIVMDVTMAKRESSVNQSELIREAYQALLAEGDPNPTAKPIAAWIAQNKGNRNKTCAP
jgi:hypothetical protein